MQIFVFFNGMDWCHVTFSFPHLIPAQLAKELLNKIIPKSAQINTRHHVQVYIIWRKSQKMCFKCERIC